MELVTEQGYQNTTVEQIADAVEVSPRTVSHYFPSKESLLLELVQGFAIAIDIELDKIGDEVAPLKAMLSANLRMLDRVERGEAGVSCERMATMLRILNTTPSLRLGAISLRSEHTATGLARRSSYRPDDESMQLASAVWSAITATAWGTLFVDEATMNLTAAELPVVMRERLRDTFAEFAAQTAP